jgi:hypothetical protein
MRWTDLPAERGAADAGASALSRGEWEDLRRRLERLPPGHPSHPDGAGEARAEEDGSPGEQPDPDPGGGGQDAPAKGHERQARKTGRARPGGLGDLPGLGGREPYRPWFTAGGPPEPWFAPDPDDAGPAGPG